MAWRWLFLAVALLPAAALAQAYRWVDDKGQVHYSEVPPAGVQSTPARPPPPPLSSPNQDALNRSLQKDQAEAPQRQQAAAQAAEADSQRKQRCQQAREQLAYMDSHQAHRMGTTDEKGNVARVTEEQFQQRRAELQKAAQESCN